MVSLAFFRHVKGRDTMAPYCCEYHLLFITVVFILLSCCTVETMARRTSIKPIPRLDCATFDPAKIKLISFDVFGALMDSYNSILSNVGSLLPQLTNAQVSRSINIILLCIFLYISVNMIHYLLIYLFIYVGILCLLYLRLSGNIFL